MKDLDTEYIFKWNQYAKIKYLWYCKKMTDTPQHIHELQLQLWLAKSPGKDYPI